MLRSRKTIAAGITSLLALATLSWAAAAPLAETLLPSTTRAFLSVTNFEQLSAHWDQTQLGQLVADPAMEPFIEDLRRQLKEKWAESHERLGLSWADLKLVPAGEVGLALVHAPQTDPAVALLIDITGRTDEARELLAKVDQNFAQRKARRSQREVLGTPVVTYELPKRPDEKQPRRALYFVTNKWLCAADQFAVIDAILKRIAGRENDTLAGLPAFRAVMDRCAKDAQSLAPDLRWYVDPFAFAAAIGAQQPPNPDAKPGQDPLAIAKNVGFSALQGVGGYLNLAVDRYDFLHRTAVYAPQPWEKSMKMLAFPNAPAAPPEPWVPAGIAAYVSLNIDAKTVEANFEPVFDQLFGEGEEGIWTEVKESLRDDPNGPGIDLVKDLVDHLGQRASLMIDYQLPITPSCERICFAVETTNEEALAATIRKSMETDPNVKHREFQGFDIWEMVDETIDVPEVEIEGEDRPNILGRRGRPDIRKAEEEAAPERLLPRSAVAVARGQLFIASHAELLETILAPRTTNDTLAEAEDYKFINAEMRRLGADQTSIRLFIRRQQAIQPTYELVRMNKLPEAQTLVAGLINRLLAGNSQANRKAQLDGSKLPEFDVVQHYFGPAGLFVTSETNGWFAVGFSPNKETLASDGESKLGVRSGPPARKR